MPRLTVISLVSACAIAVTSLCLATPSWAQQTVAPPTSAADEDVVVATGQVRGTDPAMSAFLNGDYATAEIEFQKNFERLRRADFLQDAALAQVQTNIVADLARNGPPQAGTTGGVNATLSTRSDFDVSGLNQQAKRERDTQTRVGSGDDLGYQMYMAGLSQIQLKKYDDAKTSFTRALRLTSTLHDARLRLGLLEMREGNLDAARYQYRKLLKAQKACRNRCEKLEAINLGVDTLGGALAKV